jgi:8-oxo-dGTP pyrophosphatase MutT (NUDIX family)
VRWDVHGERSVYESDWMSLRLVDVEIPGGERFDHHVVRFPRPAVGTVVVDDDERVLLLWRHRFTTDSWGWELPAGGVDPGESLEEAAVRETVEEAGWRPRRLTPLTTYHPINGATDQRFTLFLGGDAVEVGPPTDPGESERVEWVPIEVVRREVAAGRVPDGMSLTGLLWCFTFGPFAGPDRSGS